MLNNNRTTRKYALISLCFVIIFLMAPIATNPGDQFNFNTNPNLPYYDGMNLAADNVNYADSSTSDIDSSPDIGNHSNFASQQHLTKVLKGPSQILKEPLLIQVILLSMKKV